MYDIIMVFPDMVSDIVLNNLDNFVFCDSLRYKYKVPNKLSHLPSSRLRGSDGIFLRFDWEDSFIEHLASQGSIPIVETDISLYNSLVQQGYNVLVVLPIRGEFPRVLENAKKRDIVEFNYKNIRTIYLDLYNKMGSAFSIEYMYILPDSFVSKLSSWYSEGFFSGKIRS